MYNQIKKLPCVMLAENDVIDHDATIWKKKTKNSPRFQLEILMPYSLWFANVDLKDSSVDEETLHANEQNFADSLWMCNGNFRKRKFIKARKALITQIIINIIYKNKKIYVPELYSKKVKTYKPGQEEFERLFQELISESDMEHLKMYYWDDFKSFKSAIDKIIKMDDPDYNLVLDYLIRAKAKDWRLTEKAKYVLEVIENANCDNKIPDIFDKKIDIEIAKRHEKKNK